MCLAPDGSHLLVANKLDVSVAIIDPDNPSSAQTISVPITGSNTGGPVFVAATSDGNALISIGGISGPWTGSLFELNLTTLKVQSLTRFEPLRSRQIRRDCCWKTLAGAHGQCYFSISEAQFRKTESGAVLASSTLVMIRNLCPSALTSYEKTANEETGCRRRWV